MSKNSPEELDKWFQQEPEQYPFEYNAESWKQMELLLDKDKRRRLVWWWFGGISALVLISVVWFFGKNKTETVSKKSDFEKIENIETSKEEKIINLPNRQAEQLQENISTQKNTENENPNLKSNNSTSDNLQKTTPNFSKNKIVKNKKQDIYKNQKQDSNSNFKNSFPKNTQNENHIFIDSILEKTNSEIDTSDLIIPISKNKKTKFKNNSSAKIEVAPIAFLEIFLQKDKTIELNNNTLTDIIYPPILSSTIRNILNLGVVLGGESSTVNKGNLSRLNWRIGGQVEYRFARKWSTSIGANFIKKRYAANGTSYSPPMGFWDGGIPPQTIDADCNILETPINISFFSKKYSENGFYTSLGLTSFFMLREQYDYFYNLPSPDQIPSWVGKNKNRHWWSIGEFSIGYQKFLSYRSSVQIAPYLQVPLKGVGHGKVKLWSVGMNVKFNFKML